MYRWNWLTRQLKTDRASRGLVDIPLDSLIFSYYPAGTTPGGNAPKQPPQDLIRVAPSHRAASAARASCDSASDRNVISVPAGPASARR